MTALPDLSIQVAIDDILSNIHQPRQTFDDGSLAELAASIKEHGVIQPLIIYRNTGEEAAVYHFRLIAGERRLRAALLAGLTDVPCLIRETAPDVQHEFELALIENIQREDLSPADEALAYERLRNEFHLTDDQIGQRVGKAAATIRGIRRLAELPADMLALIGDGAGQLRVRDARRLIPISRLVKAEELVKAAGEIARLDADERKSIDARLGRLIEKQATVIDQNLVDFPAKPIKPTSPSAVGRTEITACTSCEFYLKLNNGYGGSTLNCLNAACHTEKKRLFADAELRRVSKKLGIPVVADDEKAPVLSLGHSVIDKARKWVANPPKHLRLSLNANPKRTDGYYHAHLTESLVVFLASTQPDVLGDKSAAPGTTGKTVYGGPATASKTTSQPTAKETPDQKAKRLEAEAEIERQRQAEELREHRAWRKSAGQKRKARADSEWLILNIAAVLAPKVPISGAWLEILTKAASEDVYLNFTCAVERDDEIDKALRTAKGAERDSLLRERLMLFLIEDGAPYSRDDWPAIRKHVTEFITGAPAKGGLSLKAPKNFDTPPVHHTESNCWICGVFAPHEELDKEDMAEGWLKVWQGDSLLNVTCPACAKKSAKAKPAAKKTAKK